MGLHKSYQGYLMQGKDIIYLHQLCAFPLS